MSVLLSLLPAALAPVSQKLRLALISQRMVEQLIDNLEGYRRDIRAHAGRFDYVNRMSHAGRQHFRFPFVVSIDFDNILQQQQPVFTNIIEPAKERTNERGAGFRCHDRLGR